MSSILEKDTIDITTSRKSVSDKLLKESPTSIVQGESVNLYLIKAQKGNVQNIALSPTNAHRNGEGSGKMHSTTAEDNSAKSSHQSLYVDYDELDRSDPDIAASAIGLFTMLCVVSFDKDAPEIRALKKIHRVFSEHSIDDCSVSDMIRALHVYVRLSRRRYAKKAKRDEMRNILDAEPQGGNEQASIEELQLFHHVLRHSEAIYGLFLNMLSSLRASLIGVTNERIVRERMGLTHSDFVVKKFRNSAFCPAHYIAIDHTISSIVVCIRGTANLADSLTDAAATCDPLQVRESRGSPTLINGYGHAGILRSARNVLRSFQNDLKKTLEKHPNYGIVLTGHSLGGAVAAVVSLLLRNEEGFPLPKAVCFGPPPCVSINLAEKCEESVISLVNGSDIVPRVSIPVLVRYFATCRHVKDQKRWRKVLIDLGLQNIALKWDRLIQSTDKYVEQHLPAGEKSRLFVAGRIFLMKRIPKSKIDSPPGSPRKKDPHCRVDRIERQHLMRPHYGVNLRVLLSHAPLSYRKNINYALKAANASPLKKPRKTLVDSIFNSHSKNEKEQQKSPRDLGTWKLSQRLLRRLSSRSNLRISRTSANELRTSKSI